MQSNIVFIDPKICRENLSVLKSIFDKHGITFWLSYGTCLGAIREGGFIAHDDDIDLDTYLQDRKRIMAIMPELKAQGFELIFVDKVRLQITRKGFDIDIYSCSKFSSKKLKMSGWLCGYELIETDFFSELKTIDFLGEEYKVPKEPIDYLIYLYGESWQKPIKNFWDRYSKDPQNLSLDLEICRENLKLIKSVLQDKHGIKFWLAEETCRDALLSTSNLIGECLTINTHLEDKGKILEILPELNQCGFETIKVSYVKFTYEYNLSLAIQLQRKNQLIKIDFVRSSNFSGRLRRIYWFYGKKSFDVNFFEKLETVVFLGEQYYVPSYPIKYLTSLYGSIWKKQEFNQLDRETRISLLTQILQEEKQIKLPCLERWMRFWEPENSLIRDGDMFTVKEFDQSLRKGMIVLTRRRDANEGQALDQLSLERIVEVRSDNQVCLTSDFYTQVNTSCKASDLIGHVISFRSRILGLTIPLDSKVIQSIFSFIMSSLRRLRSFKKF
ncbi:MAG: LicD family protein [Symploca sp. SIO2G7]|nr:LicD family protein [Symploca sp. SIO2G7]